MKSKLYRWHYPSHHKDYDPHVKRPVVKFEEYIPFHDVYDAVTCPHIL